MDVDPEPVVAETSPSVPTETLSMGVEGLEAPSTDGMVKAGIDVAQKGRLTAETDGSLRWEGYWFYTLAPTVPQGAFDARCVAPGKDGCPSGVWTGSFVFTEGEKTVIVTEDFTLREVCVWDE
jgi:hypothetical protein